LLLRSTTHREYDGRKHADSTEQWERDIYRREELDQMDYRLLIVTSRGVYSEPQRTLERVRDAARAGRESAVAVQERVAAALPNDGMIDAGQPTETFRRL
jgi:hypothetical protein